MLAVSTGEHSQSSSEPAQPLIKMIWGDPLSRHAADIGPVARTRNAGEAEPQTPSFPVAIGAGSHPFPFRTRKLSLLPPMVLRA